ncbi:MAG: plasmid maintenance protein CcdB [Alteromonadaceae bacterium]|nr:plasmid maintenance protein CcdB [Alteromonadaceae bacterium]
MAQFRVYRIGADRLVVDLQTDLIETGSRVVAPLIPRDRGPGPLPRLEPVFDIGGRHYVMHTAELAAIPASRLPDTPVADLRAHDYAIRGALDMVFSGF